MNPDLAGFAGDADLGRELGGEGGTKASHRPNGAGVTRSRWRSAVPIRIGARGWDSVGFR